MPSSFRSVLALLVSISLMCSPLVTFAQQTPEPQSNPAEAANIHYQTAVRLFGEGRYREALDEFDAAIAVQELPVFHCNRTLVLLKLQETDEAVKSLRKCRDGFEGQEEYASIDAELQGVSAYQFIVRPQAITVAQDMASGGVEQTVVTRPSPGWDLADFGYLTTGLGVALLASALTIDLASGSLADDFKRESEGGPGTSPQRYAELRDQVEIRQDIFTILLISGAVVSAAGVGMVVVHFLSFDTEEDASTVLSPWLSDRNSAGLQILGTW